VHGVIRSNRKKWNSSAQSIIELSILGAALLGILGMLLRYSSSLAQAQSGQLKAMREALKMSAAEALVFNGNGNPSLNANRKTASVLWIEDVPTVEGGEKYGAASLTPTISFGTGTMTNLLQYPLVYGDAKSIPMMDVFVNGKRFSFTTFAYGVKGNFLKTVPATWNPGGGWEWAWNDAVCDPVPGQRVNKCLTMFPKPRENTPPWGFAGGQTPAFWTKISRTDKRFCYGPNDPPDHYCTHVTPGWADQDFEERFRLDPVNGQIVPQHLRQYLQWQWFPVWGNHFAIDFYSANDSLLNLDVDFDGHEELITNIEERAVFGCGKKVVDKECKVTAQNYWSNRTMSDNYDFNPNSHCCHNGWNNYGGNFKVYKVHYIDYQNGDINMAYNTIDKLQGKPKPGFTSAKASIKTYATGDLDVSQLAQGSQTTNISTQKKDTINIIEREIQLSNNTGRFDINSSLPPCHTLPAGVNPVCTVNCSCFDPINEVDVSCSGSTCCSDGANKYRTCFNRSTLILYVRSLAGAKIGHKFKTTKPTTSFP